MQKVEHSPLQILQFNLVSSTLTSLFEPFNVFFAHIALQLHAAVYGGSLRAVELIVDAGAEIDKRDMQGRTQLHIAVSVLLSLQYI